MGCCVTKRISCDTCDDKHVDTWRRLFLQRPTETTIDGKLRRQYLTKSCPVSIDGGGQRRAILKLVDPFLLVFDPFRSPLMGCYYLRSARVSMLSTATGQPVVVLNALGWKGINCCGGVARCTDAVDNSKTISLHLDGSDTVAYWTDAIAFCISPRWHRENRKLPFFAFTLCHSRKSVQLPKDVLKLIFLFLLGPQSDRTHPLISDFDFVLKHKGKDLAVFQKRRDECRKVWSQFRSENFNFYGTACCMPCLSSVQALTDSEQQQRESRTKSLQYSRRDEEDEDDIERMGRPKYIPPNRDLATSP